MKFTHKTSKQQPFPTI